MPTKCMVQMPTARNAAAPASSTRRQPKAGVTSQDRDHHRERDEIGIVSFEHDRLGRPSPRAKPPPAAEFIGGGGNDNRRRRVPGAVRRLLSAAPQRRD